MRENFTYSSMKGAGDELCNGLRHRRSGESRRIPKSPLLWPPRHRPTLQKGADRFLQLTVHRACYRHQASECDFRCFTSSGEIAHPLMPRVEWTRERVQFSRRRGALLACTKADSFHSGWHFLVLYDKPLFKVIPYNAFRLFR